MNAHGGTQWNGAFTYWDSGRDLVALMVALDVERAIHVGMSQGGILRIRAALTGLILGPGVDTADWHNYWTSLTPGQIEDAVSALYGIEEMYDRLPQLTMPVCSIHGLADVSTPHDLALRVVEGLPIPRGVTLIEGGPHAVNMTHADKANAALRTFFEALK
jgi:3-oxoadipate enol-lactonase